MSPNSISTIEESTTARIDCYLPRADLCVERGDVEEHRGLLEGHRPLALRHSGQRVVPEREGKPELCQIRIRGGTIPQK